MGGGSASPLSILATCRRRGQERHTHSSQGMRCGRFMLAAGSQNLMVPSTCAHLIQQLVDALGGPGSRTSPKVDPCLTLAICFTGIIRSGPPKPPPAAPHLVQQLVDALGALDGLVQHKPDLGRQPQADLQQDVGTMCISGVR